MEENNKIINVNEFDNIIKKKRKRKRKRKKKNINEITTNNLNIINDIEKKEYTNIEINNNIIENDIDKKIKKRNIPQVIIFTIFIITTFIVNISIIYFNINISLIGDKLEKIEVLSTYNDPGFNAKIFKKNINSIVTITSSVNTNKIGTYTISYKLPKPINKKITRTVKVIDTTKPTITLIGSENITVYTNEPYIDKGVIIKDNYDDNLTKNLTIENNLDTSKEGTYTITYTVKDSSENISSIKRTINVKNANICNQNNKIEQYICDNN